MTDGIQFAVVVETSIRHEGDERSRTHPGHGYGEHITTHQEFKTFKDEAEFRAWIDREERKTYGKCSYQAIVYKPARVSTVVNVDVSF